MASYTISRIERRGGNTHRTEVGTLQEAIEGARNLLAGTDFMNVQITSGESKLEAPVIQDMWEMVRAARS